MFITTKIASNSFLTLQYMIYKYLESFIHNPYLVELPEKKHKLGQNLQQSHHSYLQSLKSNLLQG